ncbi:hypothetical protein [Actinomadura hibisca]|uniref:hypothetical protein n=1 Tax=Actinomadura hibisca TaxID=68565 RepID=UPI001C3F24C7|nr:hypothetical protein [Actinomadura hibisca]
MTVTIGDDGAPQGDPTETALVEGAAGLGAPLDAAERDGRRRALFREAREAVAAMARRDLRVLTIAVRTCPASRSGARTPSGRCGCSAWWACTTRRAPRSPTRCAAATPPGSACTW